MAQTLTPAHVQFLMDNGLRRVLRQDPDLPHQIVVLATQRNQHIAISCNCLRKTGDGWSPYSSSYDYIEVRPSWQPGEAIAAWGEHVAAAGEAIA